MENRRKYQSTTEFTKEKESKIERKIDPIEFEELFNIAVKKVWDLEQARRKGGKLKFGDTTIERKPKIIMYEAADLALREKLGDRGKTENNIAKWYVYSEAIKNKLKENYQKIIDNNGQLDLPLDQK